MALDAITDNGLLHWQCVILDDYGEMISCGEHKTAPIEEACYQGAEKDKSRGAVIALPECRCGAQTFLKADYSLKELWHETLAVKNEQDEVWAYVLPVRYVYNLLAHHMLYARGKTDYAPVLPMPEQELLALPHLRGVPPDVVYGLWFGFVAVQTRLKQLGKPPLPSLLLPLSAHKGGNE